MVPAVVCHCFFFFSCCQVKLLFLDRVVDVLVKCEANVLPRYRRIVGEADHSSRRSITQLLQIARFNSSFRLKEGVRLSRTSDSGRPE